MKKARPHGFSLVELMLSLVLLAILLFVTAASLRNSQQVWRQVVGSTSSEDQMKRAYVFLRRDLEMAGGNLGVSTVPGSLTASFDGDVLWFLSPLDPTTGKVARKANGFPLFMRNVIYYTVVPNNHLNIYGANCAGGAGPGGYDDRCPHKVLVRKVVDIGTTTVATNDLTEEPLMTLAQVTPYLTRPNGFSTAAMTSEAGVSTVSLVARQLLLFRVTLVPGPLQVELRATNLMRAAKSVSVGTTSLYASPLTSELKLTLAPGNPTP